MFLDFTALRNVGNFQAGLIAYFTKQVTSDTNHGIHYGASQPLFGEPSGFAPGVFVGYKFGKTDLAVYLTHDVVAREGATQGTSAFWRVKFPFN